MDREQFVENLGLLVEQLTNLTRMSGRILGWLMTSSVSGVTMPDLTEALHTSKSAISTSTRQLIQAGLIERRSVPGQRRDIFQLRPHVWQRLMLLEADKYRRFSELAAQGQDLLEDLSEEARYALVEMTELSSYLSEEAPRMIEQWKSGAAQGGGKQGVRTRKGSSPRAWEL